MKAINSAVDKYRDLILEAERYLWKNPETGYKEIKTTKYLAERFEELGYTLTYPDGITGFITRVDTGREGPELLILGELDSIICPQHPEADPDTGAVHSCGHNIQCATLLGIAAALTDKTVLEGLSGAIRLCAVPAEELLEIDYRSKLVKEGKIKYLGGKSEFLSRGLFDGVDLAFMVHASQRFLVKKGSVGCIAKKIIYKGKAAHAGGSPQNGQNALYAANCGLNAVNAIRETFVEADLIRVHPIITNGGVMVNAIPGEAVLESYVRGASFDAMKRANLKVNRAFIGAALSINTNVEIIDSPGYSPLKNDAGMMKIAEEAARIAMPDEEIAVSDTIGTGSTDMGDLSTIMPVVHPYSGGTEGTSHGADYFVTDPERACVKSAKWQLCMAKLLLENGGERAKRIISEFKPEFESKEAFLAYQDAISTSGNRIDFGDGETVTVTVR